MSRRMLHILLYEIIMMFIVNEHYSFGEKNCPQSSLAELNKNQRLWISAKRKFAQMDTALLQGHNKVHA